MTEYIPTPRRVGSYVNVYRPTADIYKGEETQSFTPGRCYDEWICNDFSILRDDNDWHIVGITHPCPRGFRSAFDHDDDIHEAEYQLFHCFARAEKFSELMHTESFRECEKLLYPAERSGESLEIWAPHLMKRNGSFEIIYSPGAIRSARTKDFKSFSRRVLFGCDFAAARDPYVL